MGVWFQCRVRYFRLYLLSVMMLCSVCYDSSVEWEISPESMHTDHAGAVLVGYVSPKKKYVVCFVGKQGGLRVRDSEWHAVFDCKLCTAPRKPF